MINHLLDPHHYFRVCP